MRIFRITAKSKSCAEKSLILPNMKAPLQSICIRVPQINYFLLTSEDSHSTNLSSESAESFLIGFFQISHPEMSHWMKKFPLTWLEFVSWKQNAHREDQCTPSVAGAYPVMFLQVVSTWDTTPFRHHLQKGVLPEAGEQQFQWQHQGAEHSARSLK